MSERDWQDSTDVFRAVFILTEKGTGTVVSRILGPFGRLGEARQRRTSWKNNYRNWGRYDCESYVQKLENNEWVTVFDKLPKEKLVITYT